MCSLVLEFYAFGLVEPSDVVVLNENMTGFTGDSGGFSEFYCGLVIFIDGGGCWLGMTEISGELTVEYDVFGAFGECFIFRFTGVKRNALFF